MMRPLINIFVDRISKYLPMSAKSAFAKDVGVVAIGQAIAQGVTFISMPIIAHIYRPHDVGIQGIFLSISGLMTTFLAFNLQTAIVLPRNDSEARGLLRLSIYVSMIISFCVALILWLAGDELFHWLGAEDLMPYRYLLVLSAAIVSIANGFSAYFTRERLYAEQAKISVVNSLSLSLMRIGLGLFSPVAINLVIAYVASGFINIVQYRSAWSRRFDGIFVKERIGEVFKLLHKYRDFIFLRTPQVTINTASQFMPVWILAVYLGPASSGYYSFAISLLGAPTALLGKAVGDAFYPRLAAAYHAGEAARPLIAKATLASLAVAIIPYSALTLFGPQIFRFLFGPQWVHSGEYARWLSCWCMLQLVNRPAVAATSVLNIQGGLLIYEIVSTSAKLGALWLGFRVFNDDITAVAFFSISGVIAYIVLIAWVIFRSGGSTTVRVGAGS